ncbi:A/G-specific adenine glycosylase [Amphiplicatus metriothermophilus]|uniref:A/G-specific adenine glycosylase n=1 Tax=Amphiplicatus metriothermophilus TaxID=1519374 RepID=UPI001793E675|nr:A/G-specific adenine glycosylase [Amphiplicatus metriothermophilus]MBB5518958.1 A/G-specific adenine glycosylase [Amphiplicatus metriothermophilus]
MEKETPRTIAARLLAWYDAHARDLPWRIGPAARKQGARPDPYAVWLSEVMLQQTTAATVRRRYADFIARWPTVEALAAAPLDEVLGAWAGLGYYARARNLHACARAVARDRGGAFPDTEEELRALPGVGRYTAAAIAAIAFDRPAAVVDGNVERVLARLFAVETPLPAGKTAIRAKAEALAPHERPGDFAQAMMDLGAMVCTPRKPACGVCPLSDVCRARRDGNPELYPRKAPRGDKPVRRGAAFALFAPDGAVLLERRPPEGLLGGMLGLPTSPWTEDGAAAPSRAAPARARWRHAGAVRHAFTHFHLDLDVYAAVGARRKKPAANQLWADPETARLPTVMRKALDRARGAGFGKP